MLDIISVTPLPISESSSPCGLHFFPADKPPPQLPDFFSHDPDPVVHEPDRATKGIKDLSNFPRTFIAISGGKRSGKSSVAGRVLHEVGLVLPEMKEVLYQSKRDYRYYIQGAKEVDNPALASYCFYEYFSMKGTERKFGLIDCPNNIAQESKNASMATVLLVVLSVDMINKDFNQQILCHLTYSPQIIIAINKMDTVNYSENEYNSAVEKVINILKEIHITTPPPIIPISATCGDNISSKSKSMPWWQGYIDMNNQRYEHLIDLFENYTRIPQRNDYSQTRLVIYREYPKIKVINGYVINGLLKENDTFSIVNGPSTSTIPTITFNSLRCNETPCATIDCRENFSSQVTSLQNLKKGNLLLYNNDLLLKHKQSSIIADITIVTSNQIKENCGVLLYAASTTFDSKVKTIMYKLEPDGTKTTTQILKEKEQARVKITPSTAFTLDCAVNCRYLGSITGHVSGKIGFIGKIVDIELSDGKFLSTIHKWSRVRLILLAMRDRNSLFPFPKEIMMIIAMFIWKLDYKDTILYDQYY